MAATTTAATRRIDSIKDEIDELKKKLALLGQNRLHNQHYIYIDTICFYNICMNFLRQF